MRVAGQRTPRTISSGSSTTLQKSRPEAARRVAQSVIERLGTLETFPHVGRPGRVQGTRDVIVPPLPFVAIYEVRDEQIIVLRILQGAQRWPQI